MSPKCRAVALYICLGVSVVVATAVRVAPLVEGGKRLQYQCVSEDGYLMLTIARNVALGHGFSVSDGLIASNGTQPLSTLLYALCYVCVGGDKFEGLYGVVGLQIATSLLTAVLLYVMARKYLYKGPHPGLAASIAACVWYASPASIMHTQNSLETGLCALLILASIALYDRISSGLRSAFSPLSCLALGTVLGLTFLGRNDACFLIAVMLAIHVVMAQRRDAVLRAVLQALVFGATSVAVATPWLWFNLSRFGHLVPVSGRAESVGFVFARNLLPASAAMVENMLLVLRVPLAIETSTRFQFLCSGFLLSTMVVVLWRRRWFTDRFSTGVGMLAVFVAVLFLYYSLCFKAAHFLGRYFFPLVMLCSLVGGGLVASLAGRVRTHADRAIAAVAVSSAMALCIALNVRLYIKGQEHLHSQVVDWVDQNVAEDAWVAGVQTGTLGYYHDRTINLDGKVDPNALEALMVGQTAQYLLERDVMYVVDWRGIALWASLPDYSPYFELIVDDPERNLAVLRRRSSSLGDQGGY